MGPAFVVLAAVYRLAVGEVAAIAKPALHMVLPAIGVATPLHYPGGIAALQPEVGGRGHWRGADRSRQRERGSHSVQSHFPLPPPAMAPSEYTGPEKTGTVPRHPDIEHILKATKGSAPILMLIRDFGPQKLRSRRQLANRTRSDSMPRGVGWRARLTDYFLYCRRTVQLNVMPRTWQRAM